MPEINTNLLHEKLIRVARADVPSDRVPYAFEQRILARIRTEPDGDAVTVWVRALWRAAIPCVGAMLVLAAWGAYQPQPSTASGDSVDLDAQLETTLMASVSVDNELVW